MFPLPSLKRDVPIQQPTWSYSDGFKAHLLLNGGSSPRKRKTLSWTIDLQRGAWRQLNILGSFRAAKLAVLRWLQSGKLLPSNSVWQLAIGD